MSRRSRSRGSLRARAAAFSVSAGVVVVSGLLALGGEGGTVVQGPTQASAARGDPAASGGPSRGRDLAPAPSAGGPGELLELGHPDRYDFSFGRSEPAAGLLFDIDSGEVLWRRRPFRRLPIASVTKILSALIIVNETDPNDSVRIRRKMREVEGSAVGLPRGKRVRVESLLAAMLIQSGNDAALALADVSEGSIPNFVDEMNDKADRLGLDCSRFISPHGLEPANRSCAADLGVMATLAMARPRIARQVRRPGARVPWPTRAGKLDLAPTNPLLIDPYPGTIGLKTGYTAAAGRSLVAVVRRDGRTLVAVLIDSSDPAGQARKLFDRGFVGAGSRRR